LKLKQLGYIEESKKLFNLLGYIIARGLYDDRLLDIQLSSLFWDLVLKRVTTIIILYLLIFIYIILLANLP